MELTDKLIALLKKGAPVYGTIQKSFSKNDALEILEECLKSRITVFGGDVVEYKNNYFEHNKIKYKQYRGRWETIFSNSNRIELKKSNDKTIIKTVKAHPTLVYSKLNGRCINGIALYDYKVMILEDFIVGGKHRDKLDEKMKKKVDIAYKEMMEHVNLKW